MAFTLQFQELAENTVFRCKMENGDWPFMEEMVKAEDEQKGLSRNGQLIHNSFNCHGEQNYTNGQ